MIGASQDRDNGERSSSVTAVPDHGRSAIAHARRHRIDAARQYAKINHSSRSRPEKWPAAADSDDDRTIKADLSGSGLGSSGKRSKAYHAGALGPSECKPGVGHRIAAPADDPTPDPSPLTPLQLEEDVPGSTPRSIGAPASVQLTARRREKGPEPAALAPTTTDPSLFTSAANATASFGKCPRSIMLPEADHWIACLIPSASSLFPTEMDPSRLAETDWENSSPGSEASLWIPIPIVQRKACPSTPRVIRVADHDRTVKPPLSP